jgi:drug/metabolite transporter (DMT)-like permease
MKIILTFILMISCTVIANLLMKTGASGMEAGFAGFLARLITWKVLLGLTFFGTSAMLYLLILGWLPLSVAQSFAAAQFVAVILASWIILAESITVMQLMGMCLITLGIAVVGWGS